VVRFRPDPEVFGAERVSVESVRSACAGFETSTDIEINEGGDEE